jgi:reverse gyrase
MAEHKKNLNEQEKEQEKMVKAAEREARKDVKELKAEAKEQKNPPKPYVHIDTFLQTAVPLYGLSGVQAAGFKAKMNGQHYQRDEKVFVKALKEHFNIDPEKKEEN